MSLATGERIHSNNWAALPITDEVINAVNEHGQQEGQPVLCDGVPIFEWRCNIPVENDDEEQDDNEEENNEGDVNVDAPFGEEPGNHNANEDGVDPLENRTEENEDNSNVKEDKAQEEQHEHEIAQEERSIDDYGVVQEEMSVEWQIDQEERSDASITSDNSITNNEGAVEGVDGRGIHDNQAS